MTISTDAVPQGVCNAPREARPVREQELTRARDAPAAGRRRLPMVLQELAGARS